MPTTEELEAQLKNLQSEILQMKEIINALFNMVVETEEDDEEYAPFGLSGGIGRFNT